MSVGFVSVCVSLCVHENHVGSVLARCWLGALLCVISISLGPHDSPVSPALLFPFTDEEVKACKSKVTCLRSRN